MHDDRWSILCRDGAGRARDLVIFVTEAADVAVRVPPGEVAVIGPNQVGEVKHALSEAQIKAIARRHTC